MAYVRKTDTLVSDILYKVQAMSRAAEADVDTETKVKLESPIHKSIYKSIMDAAWSLAPEMRDTMPKAWQYECTRLDVSFRSSDDKFLHSLDFDPSSEIPLMLPTPRRDLGRYGDSIVVREQFMDSTAMSWLEDATAGKAKVDSIRKQFDEVYSQIKLYLDTKTSLNVALKDMPELELYVPEDYMRKIREPNPTRAKVAKPDVEEVEVNRAQLATLGIAHRLTAGA